MEAGSGGEDERSNNNSDRSPSEGPKKPKRQMKTPFQLETLEKTYALEMYPSEAIRVQLSEKLGLTDRQLQMWFCHRRLKDKKDAAATKARAAARTVVANGLLDSNGDDCMDVDLGSDKGSGSASGSGSDSSQFHYGDDVPIAPRYYDSSPQWVTNRRVVACVEAQLGEPLREDAPAIGVEFDEPPPGAFGASIVMAEQQDQYGHFYKASKRDAHGRPILPDEPSISRSDAYGRLFPSHFYDSCADVSSAKTSFVHENKRFRRGHFSSPSRDSAGPQMDAPVNVHPVLGPENMFISSGRQISKKEDALSIERKCKSVEVGIEMGIEVCETNIPKELEKQDILIRKRDGQMRREVEKQDRERRKEEERMMREKQRREEKSLREERREIERREKFLQKESLRAERRRQKEELRREKEAARLKAAVEKATARKVARESLELIEDERLELMELAASSKGLASIISLDHDTLQNLESFRDFLCTFPPKSLQLKRPFTIQPWIASEECVGNLLMVWRFCINFADVLELWPFTLDEFIQAFHDHDSRLLGEIHIALLKLIIKDIEDVARTPSIGLGTNQYTASNPEGGHPQIVEGAYIWGFDIRRWRNHLNPLTWPEILRQFALSAGFGPKLKKKSIEQALFHDNDEGRDCEDKVSTLRNGSAAENAVAIMQEKGFSLQRRSRHRLTPGTVKFAAYHVLCLEGSKGLTVLEVADKIQKSGLRDLTTSKTPEASISVALSRDAILFERTAPSTYRVRPAFRKDPADAEVILAAAQEKVQRYKNGFFAGENADGVERDEDSECDVAESPEVDDLDTPLDANKNIAGEVSTCSGNRNENLCNDVTLNLRNDDCASIGAVNPDQGDTEIDESKSGEAWVQGLTEGEYSDLCVEERLSALVAMVGIANEGNSVRSILEDRLDAANALRKQMWAEARVDKRRMKEQSLTKFQSSIMGIEAERKPACSAAEGSQSPLPILRNKNDEASLSKAVKEEPFIDASMGHITNPAQQNGYSAERSHAQLKSYIGHRAEELYSYRSLPLGQDRRRNRYWQFVASASQHDPGSGRIFIESPDGHWRLIDCEGAFDALLMSLDTRGVRESHLHIMLQKVEMSFKENVARNLQVAEMVSSPASIVYGSFSDTTELSSSFRIQLGRTESEKKGALRRYQDFQMWMWQQCFSSSTLCAVKYGKKSCTPLLGVCKFCFDMQDDSCPSCYKKFDTFDDTSRVSEHVIQSDEKRILDSSILDSSHPLIFRLLRSLLTFVEASIPSEALQSSWTENYRKTRDIKLHTSSSIEDFLQILTQLEGVIKRDWLSSNFETTEELLGSCSLSERALFDSAIPGAVPHLPWIPQTSAAVALRLFELDASISYIQDQKVEAHSDQETENFIKLQSDHGLKKNMQEANPTEPYEDDEHMREENWVDPGVVASGSGRERVVRGKGSGVRARVSWPKSVAGHVSEYTHGECTPGERSGWGRRTLRTKRPEKRPVEEILLGSSNATRESLGNFDREVSGGEQMVNGDHSNWEDDRESDDIGLEIGYECQRPGFDVASNGVGELMGMSDEDMDGSEDGNGYEEGKDVNLGEDVDLNDCSDGNEDEGTDFAVSDDSND